MADAFQQLPIRLGGGLNLVDSPELLATNAALVLENWRITGAGRWTTRGAGRLLATLLGELVGLFPYGFTTYSPDAGGAARASALVAITWDNPLARLYLLDENADDAGKKMVGTLVGWTSVTTKPKVHGDTLSRVLFLCDEGREHGLTCYDPNDVLGSAGAGGLFQPKFIFDAGPAAVMKCRTVKERKNILFTAGYGAESEPDRGEIIRYSYVGLEPDTLGAGDAGDGATAGSTGLFDLEDAVYLSRGVAVIGLERGDDWLMVGTALGLHRLIGSDRFSFDAVEVDPERSLVSTRAMVNADGIVFGLSPLGAWRFAGGLDPIDSRKILPRLLDMDYDSVFAAHDRDHHQVLWYYTLATERGLEPDQVLIYDYSANEWLEDTLPYRVACAGWARPGSGGGTTTLLPPAGPPSSLGHSSITSSGAVASWTPGDTSPGCVTKVYRAPDVAGSPGAWTLVDTFAASVGVYSHSGLAASTTYWTKVEHTKNGTTTASVQDDFTTEASGYVPPPVSPAVTLLDPDILAYWSLGAAGLQTEVFRRIDPAGYGALPLNTTAADATSHTSGSHPGNTYYFKFRHKDGSGNVSAFTAEVSVST